MNVVTDVRTTQRTCKRASGRTRGVRVDGRVCLEALKTPFTRLLKKLIYIY